MGSPPDSSWDPIARHVHAPRRITYCSMHSVINDVAQGGSLTLLEPVLAGPFFANLYSGPLGLLVPASP